MKTVVVIQARRGSTRLPNKVLLPLAGATLLERMIERVRAASTPFETIVATTTLREDDVIESLCEKMDVACARGNVTDLLDRHIMAAESLGAEAVVKIPSDCPLIDPAVIDRVLGFFLKNAPLYDYAGNLHPASWPDGNDVEIMSMDALRQAWREATQPSHREHTTPFIWTQPDRFTIGNVAWETGFDYSATHRWTIDYAADYAFIRAVYDRLYSESRPVFTVTDILNLLGREPGLASLNRAYAGETWITRQANGQPDYTALAPQTSEI